MRLPSSPALPQYVQYYLGNYNKAGGGQIPCAKNYTLKSFYTPKPQNKPHTSESQEEDTLPDAGFRILSGIDTNQIGPHHLITPQQGTLMIPNGLCTNSVLLLAMQHHPTMRTVWEPQVVPVCNKYRL